MIALRFMIALQNIMRIQIYDSFAKYNVNIFFIIALQNLMRIQFYEY